MFWPEFPELPDNFEQPRRNLVFRAFEFFKPYETKVVIIGQDPYPNDNACGLCFSSEQITPSLRNIMTCVDLDSSNLEHWAEQGVLLLNTSLTYPGDYRYWEPFITKVIKCLPSKTPFFLWGNHAKKLNVGKGIRYEYSHPSPMSRIPFNCDHFQQVNEVLKVPINWQRNELKDEICVGFTDGSGGCGWGVYFPKTFTGKKTIFSGKKHKSNDETNIRNEGLAIKECIRVMRILARRRPKIRFILFTDSMHWINGINGTFKFSSHKDLLKSIMKKMIDVEIYHVYSHKKKKIIMMNLMF